MKDLRIQTALKNQICVPLGYEIGLEPLQAGNLNLVLESIIGTLGVRREIIPDGS